MKRPKPLGKVYQSSNLYRTCQTLTMDRFLTCLCDEDLTALIQQGTADPEELHHTWIIILSDYHELREEYDNGTKEWHLTRDIRKIRHHLLILQYCIDFLCKQWSPEVAKVIRGLGYPFKPKDIEPEKYLHLLAIVVEKAKTKYVQLQQLMVELEAMMDKRKDGKPTRVAFEEQLIQIGIQNKVDYSMNTVTVQKYVLLEKNFIKQIEAAKAKNAY